MLLQTNGGSLQMLDNDLCDFRNCVSLDMRKIKEDFFDFRAYFMQHEQGMHHARRLFVGDMEALDQRLKTMEKKRKRITLQEIPADHGNAIDEMKRNLQALQDRIDDFVSCKKDIPEDKVPNERLERLEEENAELKRKLERLETLVVKQETFPRAPSPEQPRYKCAKLEMPPQSDVATPYTDLVKKVYDIPPEINWAQMRVVENGRMILFGKRIPRANWFLDDHKLVKSNRGTYILKPYISEFLKALRRHYPTLHFNGREFPFQNKYIA